MFGIMRTGVSCQTCSRFRCYLWGKKKINTMKGIIKQLFFDKELVKNLKAAKPRREQLYVPLMEGKITLKEYLAAAV